MLAVIIFFIMSSVSAVHFYWAFGGRRYIDFAIPKDEQDEALFKPNVLTTLIVAVIFLSIAILAIVIGFKLANFEYLNIGYIIAGVFLLRAIGDFKYVGLFKRIKDSKFAYYDTKFFTPLVLTLAFSFVLITI